MSDPWSPYKKVVVLTGAGISVASGLGTYRGSTAVKSAGRPPTVHLLERDPHEIWKIFAPRKEAILASRPNPAHVALARLEEIVERHGSFRLVTQNVDEFHQGAGSRNVIEMHGSLISTRCGNERCATEPFRDDHIHLDELPLCPECGTYRRPDIVLFGEQIKLEAGEMHDLFFDTDLFLAVGTSGSVYPAARFGLMAKERGARTVAINFDRVDNLDTFDRQIVGKAEEILPDLVERGLE